MRNKRIWKWTWAQLLRDPFINISYIHYTPFLKYKTTMVSMVPMTISKAMMMTAITAMISRTLLLQRKLLILGNISAESSYSPVGRGRRKRERSPAYHSVGVFMPVRRDSLIRGWLCGHLTQLHVSSRVTQPYATREYWSYCWISL